ncbi:MAG: condensation domain-containing protein [Jatrophihabitantaceae bacterium]
MTSTCRQQGSAPLTFQQQARIERARQARAAGSAPRSNLVTDAVSITGPLDADRLQSAAGEVRRRQPALRSRFFPDHQELWPCHPSSPSLPRLDLSRIDPAPLDRPLTAPAEFAPDGPDRFALSLHRTGEHQHELRLAADHLVFDARSLEIFWENLWNAYLSPGADGAGQGCRCEPGYLEMLTRGTRQSERSRELTESVIEILRKRHSPFGYVDLPMRLGLDSVGSRRVSVLSLPVPSEVQGRAAELARSRRTTVFAVITAAAFAAIGDVGDTETPMLYTFLENRRSASARTAIGWFAATTLLTAAGSGKGDEVGQAKQILLDALISGAQGTEQVHRACGQGRRHANLPSVSLSMGQPARNAMTVGDIEVNGVAESDGPTGSVPRGRIAIDYWPQLIQLSYETDRFDASTVQAFGDALRSEIERLVS